MNIRALHTPCHTVGSVCYMIEDKADDQKRAVFTGDTMFVGKHVG
jgi:hydroxyacylglutathione hydrolase